MLKAIVDNGGEFTPEQHHARRDVGGHTDEVDVVYFALYWYFYFFGYEVFLMKYLLSILLKRICVHVSFMKSLHTSWNMEEGAHRA